MGRVMTPTMALVVRREEEISKFKPVTHYAVKEIFANNFGEIPATWQVLDKVPSLDSEGRLLDKKVAEDFLTRLNVLVGRQGKIIRIEEKIRERISDFLICRRISLRIQRRCSDT